MKRLFLFSAVFFLLASLPAFASTKVQIASVPAQYTPKAGAELPEPVSVAGYRFEVNNTKTRARVVVDYTYPDQTEFGPDGGLGPTPTMVQVPGLSYDRENHKIIYTGEGRSTVCADVREHHSPLRAKFSVTSSGACVVTSVTADHAVDNGWNLHHAQTVDTYLEVRDAGSQQASVRGTSQPADRP